jgi:hypothetical protein
VVRRLVAVSVQHVPAVTAAEGSSAGKVTGGSGALVANRAVVAKSCMRQAGWFAPLYQSGKSIRGQIKTVSTRVFDYSNVDYVWV